jgi:hypothetical protein
MTTSRDDDQYLEAMLAKAERLANEMKEISTKHSNSGFGATSSSSKDGRTRSLPKTIDVQQDDTARSECSSLGYSLATATPFTQPSSVNLLTTTIENCGEGFCLRTDVDPTAPTTSVCSVINEGSTHNDEKKSCGSSIQNERPIQANGKLNIFKNVATPSGYNDENLRNKSSVDMVFRSVNTPPKVKRLDPTGKLPNPNPALLATLSTTKSLSEDIEASQPVVIPKTLPPQRPTIMKISQQDDDYVPIADYSIRNTTTTITPSNGVVKWEKVNTPKCGDDDYVSLKDYSTFPKSKKGSLSVRDKTSERFAGLTFAEKHAMLLMRRREKKRRRRFIAILLLFLSMMVYSLMSTHSNKMSAIVSFIINQLHHQKISVTNNFYEAQETIQSLPEQENLIKVLDFENETTFDDILLEIVTTDIPPNNSNEIELSVHHFEDVDEADENFVDGENEDMQQYKSKQLQQQHTQELTTATLFRNNLVIPTWIQNVMEPSERRRWVEDLINNMMQ